MCSNISFILLMKLNTAECGAIDDNFTLFCNFGLVIIAIETRIRNKWKVVFVNSIWYNLYDILWKLSILFQLLGNLFM